MYQNVKVTFTAETKRLFQSKIDRTIPIYSNCSKAHQLKLTTLHISIKEFFAQILIKPDLNEISALSKLFIIF